MYIRASLRYVGFLVIRLILCSTFAFQIKFTFIRCKIGTYTRQTQKSMDTVNCLLFNPKEQLLFCTILTGYLVKVCEFHLIRNILTG